MPVGKPACHCLEGFYEVTEGDASDVGKGCIGKVEPSESSFMIYRGRISFQRDARILIPNSVVIILYASTCLLANQHATVLKDSMK